MYEVKIGDIGWRVFKEEGNLVLSRMKVVDMSPTGASLHWRALDVEDQSLFKGRHQAGETRNDAVTCYQIKLVLRFSQISKASQMQSIPDLIIGILDAEELLETLALD